MRIGILSDTHGRTQAMADAIRLLKSAGAEFFIHCGDVGSEAVLDLLAGEKAAFVFGNTDFDRQELQRYARIINVQCLENSGQLQLGGKEIRVMHGDDSRALRRAIEEQSCDAILFGHTHVKADRREGRVRLINPGALHRAAVKTVALWVTETDDLSFIEVHGE
jgi:uncharacterized protein